MSNLLSLNDRDFNQTIISAGLPCLVEFWASWCPPCKMAEPMLEELAQELKASIIIAKINVDQNPATASFYKISGVPTFIIFEAGKEINRCVGAQSKQQLKDMFRLIGIGLESKQGG